MTIWNKELKIDLNSSSNIVVYLQSIYGKILSCCLKCRENTERKKQNVLKTKNERIMFLSKYAVCDREKKKFIKE